MARPIYAYRSGGPPSARPDNTASGSLVHHSCQKTYPPPARLTTVGLACNLFNNLRRELIRSSSQNFDLRGAKHCIAATALLLNRAYIRLHASIELGCKSLYVEFLRLFTAKFYHTLACRSGGV